MKTINPPRYTGAPEAVHVHANGHMRDLINWHDLTDNERRDFDYITADEHDDYRFFRYLGSVYDEREFERAPSWLSVLGYDGWQTDSAFSATVVKYFNEFGYELDGIIVARIHW